MGRWGREGGESEILAGYGDSGWGGGGCGGMTF